MHLGPQWHVKLADFGSTKSLEGSALSAHPVGTRDYMAPEIQRAGRGSSRPVYDTAVDIWSLGVVLFFLQARDIPFKDSEALGEYSRDISAFPESLLKADRRSCNRFIREALRYHASERPTIDDLWCHEWLTPYQEPATMAASKSGSWAK